MMKPNTYLTYLETIVLSLIAERKDKDADIVTNDPEASASLKGFSSSPILVKEEIAKQRQTRK